MTTRDRPVPAVRGRFPVPLGIDAASGAPLHRQIFEWYQAAILEGRLRPGQAIASTRGLAKELGISRAPVLAAFEQLMAEGYIETWVGAGTRVSATIPDRDRHAKLRPAPIPASGRVRASRRAASLPSERDPWLLPPGAFRSSLPALEAFPTATWAALVARHARAASPETMGYGDPMGHLPLRSAIADYLAASRGVRCGPGQVMIVSGSQQGLQVAARAVLDEGDAVIMENPGYPGAHAAFASAGLEMIPVPIDAEGLDVAGAARLAPDARAAYVTPSHQYPLGVGMTAARRMQLLQWSTDADAWIIEDDYDSEFRFGARPVLSLQGLDDGGRVIYLGTFSKVMFPSLRVGYLVVPEDVVPAFRATRETLDIFPATQVQAALAEFIADGHFARHLRRMRMLYAGRRERLVAGLRQRIPGLQVVGMEAGMHLTALLPDDIDDVAVALRSAERGVSVIPLSTCCLGGSPRRGFVLGYGAADDAEIERGIDVLAAVLRG